jgi:hypothetical protein
VPPYGDTIEEVTTTALSKRTLAEGLFLIRLETEEAQRRYKIGMDRDWYYEVIPIAQHSAFLSLQERFS